MVVHQDQIEALKPVEAQTRNDLLLAVLVTVLAAVAGMWLTQVLAGPVIRLERGSRKSSRRRSVGPGEGGIQVDETGTLATTFNKMVAQLSNLIGTLEQRVSRPYQSLGYLR